MGWGRLFNPELKEKFINEVADVNMKAVGDLILIASRYGIAGESESEIKELFDMFVSIFNNTTGKYLEVLKNGNKN